MSHSILIVDDSATTRAIIKRAIQMANLPAAHVAEAANGIQALQMLATETYDLVLADLNMPEMTGEEMTAIISADPVLCHIPVVIVSAEPNADQLLNLYEHKPVACLKKPFTPEQIKKVITDALGAIHA